MIDKMFYESIYTNLIKGTESVIVTFISGNYKGESVLGQKVYFNNSEVYFSNSIIKELWDEIGDEVKKELHFNEIKEIGDYEFLIQNIKAQPELIICGAGHIAVPLSKIGKLLDYKITVIDNREEFANYERFNETDNIICGEFKDVLSSYRDKDNGYYVIVTRGHKDDKVVLQAIIDYRYKYIGMIGSNNKINTLKKELEDLGYNKAVLENINWPIGLQIGAKTPEEIAVSIIAEIISIKNKEIATRLNDLVLERLVNKKSPKVLITIISKIGSSPREVGAQMLVYGDRQQIGTIGGGAIEYEAFNIALSVLTEKKNLIKAYDLSKSAASQLGMVCGGEIKLLFEYID